MAKLFGADLVLFADIKTWETRYLVISSATEVSVKYTLKSGATGDTLWERTVTTSYSPQANGGNPIASLIARAIVAAVQRAHPNYIPVANRANFVAFREAGQGLPAGPYDPNPGSDATDRIPQ